MSDLSVSLQALERSRAQLPVTSYFDVGLFETEQSRIFKVHPRYLGHALSVPEVGNYQALAHESEGRVLVRTEQGVQLLSNVCRHRQAVMLKGRGHTGSHIVCPLHRWTYSNQGQLVGAPHFAQDPCLNLRNYAIQEWNGLVFERAAGQLDVSQLLSGLGVAPDLDFSGFQYHSAQLHECNYNWKTFIEVYLEDYHVVPFHPGLGGFVECEDLRWEFGQHHSVQTVGVRHALARPGSEIYRKWHDAVLSFRGGEPPRHGAIWLTLFPTVMVEWYPHVLVVSSLHPQGPRKTLNLVEFFYPEEIMAFEPDFIAAQQAAYMETVLEDDEIGERMDAGRHALMQRGENEVGPYQSPMEDGMQHFHEWYRKAMNLPAQP
ncbi:MAG: aromatic ring-hydroxylating dioxygenase subunit alpha [Betaproteobacteria bacterium]|nr:aromatic ring-hydroxylating dioxygenase subunit alpha [Betaproteobacteria bacterium]